MAAGFPERVIHGGTGKRQREKTRKNVLDFSASVNPYPPVIAWQCNPADLSYYPDDTYSELKERIGQVYDRDPSEICVGNGSIEIIRVFCAITLRHSSIPGRFFIDPPTFGEYELSARLAGAERSKNPETADVRFVCNPNNPTGTLQSRDELMQVLDRTKQQGGILFCDEAFIDLADPNQSLSSVKNPHLFVLHSLTKSFSVPGLRIGFGFGDTDLIEKIETARSPWCVNAYAEAFAMEALLHREELKAARAAISYERNRMQNALEKLGLICHPSSANYLLVECGRIVAPLCDSLTRHDILVRDCSSFGLPTCIRVAIRTADENTRLLEALACVL